MKRQRPSVAGFTLFELIVVVVIVAILFVVALERYLYLAERAEATMVLQNIQAIKTGMRMEVIARLIRHPAIDYRDFVHHNPIVWLEEPMVGYRGEFAAAQAPNCKGCWFFDLSNRQLVYRPRLTRYFQPHGAPTAEIRLWVEIAQENRDAAVNTFIGLNRATLRYSSFVWFDLFTERSRQ